MSISQIVNKTLTAGSRTIGISRFLYNHEQWLMSSEQWVVSSGSGWKPVLWVTVGKCDSICLRIKTMPYSWLEASCWKGSGDRSDSLLSWNCRRSATSGYQCVPFGVLAKVMRNEEWGEESVTCPMTLFIFYESITVKSLMKPNLNWKNAGCPQYTRILPTSVSLNLVYIIC